MNPRFIPVIATWWLFSILLLALLPNVSMAKDTAALGEQPIKAAERGDLSGVKTLLDKGADVNAKDQDGWTALKRAQKRGSTEIVELLKAHGAKE
jgi:uncharacterized protein